MSTDARGAREYAADDGFHEIQLSGKQLVFLFMATTVVSIVIFLCGVLVGRGGRPEPTALEAIGTPVTDAGAPAAAAAAAPTEAVVPSAQPSPEMPTDVSADDQEYLRALGAETSQPTIETPADDDPTASAAAAPASAAPPPSTPVASAIPAPVPSAPAPAPSSAAPAAAAQASTPSRSGWTIQVSAFRDKGQADQFAAKLKAKQYDAYVAPPDASSPLFRVRVGSFGDRRDATRMADRLKKDKFKPWLTR